jgi:hypothetical protein
MPVREKDGTKYLAVPGDEFRDAPGRNVRPASRSFTVGRKGAHIRVHGASRILGLGVDLLTEVGLENQIGDEVGHRQANRHQR